MAENRFGRDPDGLDRGERALKIDAEFDEPAGRVPRGEAEEQRELKIDDLGPDPQPDGGSPPRSPKDVVDGDRPGGDGGKVDASSSTENGKIIDLVVDDDFGEGAVAGSEGLGSALKWDDSTPPADEQPGEFHKIEWSDEPAPDLAPPESEPFVELVVDVETAPAPDVEPDAFDG